MKYIPYVNIKQGTASISRFSNGNTLPLVQRPFGMAPFCLQSDMWGGRWFFHPDHPYAEGIRLTHQPSPWLGEYGTFLMMPQNDVISNNAPGAWSGYRVQDAVFRPDYLKVTFLRSNCTLELTPTDRGGAVRLTFHDNRPSVLSFMPVDGNYTYHYNADTHTLIGTNDAKGSGVGVDFKAYLAVKFLGDVVDDEKVIIQSGKHTTNTHIPLTSRTVEARIGFSYISEEMALSVIDRECGCRSFDEIRQESEDVWEEKLSRIEVTTETEDEMRTFYSCLWRTFLFPQKAYELDADGNPIHYVPATGEIKSGVRYTNNGFWDTARTVYPLFTLTAREEFAEMLDGFVNDYKESGWLPRWLGLGEIGCMPSTLIDGVIACAAINGIGKRETLETALEGMLHHANNESENPIYGRNGALSYCKYGYVPRNEQKESVNLTLDAAYGDWCIATVAKVLGRDDLVDEYMARSKNYQNLFDPQTGFMRGRDTDGSMAEDFDPCTWGGEYTEGSAWQNSMFVPHDVEGLAALYGGKERFLAKLDELFATPPHYRVFGYGNEIHEMTEMASADFGQCAISNQPSFHLPFLYAALGEQEKTEYWVSKLCREAFSWSNDGFPGDEDNGTTSAWYILASLGMYPLCPGKKDMIRFQPLVKSFKIR